MRIFGAILSFLTIFFIFIFTLGDLFNGLGAIFLIFAFLVSLIFVVVAFGIIDIFLPAEEEEHDLNH